MALYVQDEKGNYSPASPDLVLSEAKQVIADKMKRGAVLSSPDVVRDTLQVGLASREHEVFGCLFLDNRNRLIENKVLFRGTINQASVYPREVVKESLSRNSAAVIFYHNHPSGIAEPSEADNHITKLLKEALKHLDIRVLDHFIVGFEGVFSYAERGLL